MTAIEPTLWTGCYDDSWKGIIVDAAFAHPAKIARGLSRRIYRHMRERGWLKPGDCVVDPFGGIAGTALDAMEMGCHWYGCELESKANGGSPFVELGNENIAKWAALGMSGTAVLVQGDSRKLCENLGALMQRNAGAAAVLSSPPYATETVHDGNSVQPERLTGNATGKNSQAFTMNEYGRSDGQLGSMRSGSVEEAIADCVNGSIAGIVSSPPYAQAITGDHRETETASETRDKRQTEGGAMGRSCRHGGYGGSDGNLSAMQAGEVADALVGSPPFEGSLSLDRPNPAERRRIARENGISNAEHVSPIDMERIGKRHEGDYGGDPANIGNQTGDTFWSASRVIVEQCYAILRVGGICAWIVKAFVRKGEIVDFPGDWQRLCEACGFETVEVVHASLVKETRTPDLFGGEHVERTERKSFFRRLAEKKGSPRIDHECVLFMRKV